jgi:hypothetical protein
MRRSLRIPTLLTGLALSLAACGGDGPTANSGDELSEAEMNEIAAEMFDGLAGLISGDFDIHRSTLLPPGLSLSLSRLSVPINISIDESGPCEGGGTVSLEGSVDGDVDDESGAGELHLDVTQTVDGCDVVGELHTYTVTTEPNLHLTGDFESDGGDTFSASMNLVGGFAFIVDDGREGTCGVDVTVTVEVEGQNFSASAQGTICGISVNDSIVFGD